MTDNAPINEAESLIAQYKDLLTSAHAIAERKGEHTAWDVFTARLRKAGIGSVTPRVFKLPHEPEDTRPPHVIRMEQELKELNGRLNKLTAYLQAHTAEDPADPLMYIQRDCMQAYAHTLRLRLRNSVGSETS